MLFVTVLPEAVNGVSLYCRRQLAVGTGWVYRVVVYRREYQGGCTMVGYLLLYSPWVHLGPSCRCRAVLRYGVGVPECRKRVLGSTSILLMSEGDEVSLT